MILAFALGAIFAPATVMAIPPVPRATSDADAKRKADEGYRKYCGSGSAGETPGEISRGALGGDGMHTAAVGHEMGSFGAVAKEASAALEKYKVATADYKTSPVARESIERLEQCKSDADKMGDTAKKQEEDAKKSNEDKGSGGGMPDLSSLMNALKKEPKPEEQAKELPLDCSNPASSSNPICMCQVNPRGGGCGTQEQQDYSTAKKERNSRGTDDSGSSSGPSPSSPYQEERQSSKSAAAGLPAGGSGGGAGGSSSGGGSSGSDNSLGAPMAKPLSVIEGSYGGGGGARSAGGGYNTALGRANMAIQRNLANAKARSPASDGLTGPHTNLFGKIRIRYMSVRGSLNP